MSDRADIVIIGAGAMGLSLAYHLSLSGRNRIVVLEKSYLCSGASGRCGGGVRQQWTTEENMRLMKESLSLLRDFSSATGFNIWFRQGGYVFLAENSDHMETLSKSLKLHNSLGVPTRLLGKAELARLVPVLNTSGLLGGNYCPTDGVLFPYPVLWGYAKAAASRGVDIRTFTEVTGMEVAGGRISKVLTGWGEIETGHVVNAAGAWSPVIASMAGVELPNKPVKHEILVTEPLAPFLEPALVCMGSGLWAAQTLRGELISCVGLREEPTYDQESSFEFLQKISTLLVTLMPRLSNVKLLRAWAGLYDTTPDTNPIIGPVEGVANFFQLSGFMGHGFMMAPAVGKLAARWITTDSPPSELSRYRLSRFKSGALEKEKFIVG